MDRKDTEDIYIGFFTSLKYYLTYIGIFFFYISICIFPFLKLLFYRWSGKLIGASRWSSSPYFDMFGANLLSISAINPSPSKRELVSIFHKSICKTIKYFVESNFRPRLKFISCLCCRIFCIPFHIQVENLLALTYESWSKLQQYVLVIGVKRIVSSASSLVSCKLRHHRFLSLEVLSL